MVDGVRCRIRLEYDAKLIGLWVSIDAASTI